jgi:hypothetical protein
MKGTYGAAVREFIFSDSEDERIYLDGFISEFEMKSGRGMKSGKREFLRAAVKAMYLFWIDYQAYRTGGSQDEFNRVRASIKKSLAKGAEKKKARPLADAAAGLYAVYGQRVKQDSKWGDLPDADAAEESTAFFSALLNNGIRLLGPDYADLRERTLKFFGDRKAAILERLAGGEA